MPFFNCNVTVLRGRPDFSNFKLTPVGFVAQPNCSYSLINKQNVSSCNIPPSNSSDYFYQNCITNTSTVNVTSGGVITQVKVNTTYCNFIQV